MVMKSELESELAECLVLPEIQEPLHMDKNVLLRNNLRYCQLYSRLQNIRR